MGRPQTKPRKPGAGVGLSYQAVHPAHATTLVYSSAKIPNTWLVPEQRGQNFGGEGGIRRAPPFLAVRNFSHARDEQSLPPDTRGTIRL